MPGRRRALAFMSAAGISLAREVAVISAPATPARTVSRFRSPADFAEDFAEPLLAEEEVRPIGLGRPRFAAARSGTLPLRPRIDATTSPIEAGLDWSIPNGAAPKAVFPAPRASRRELAQGPAQARRPAARGSSAPAREGAEIADATGAMIGTSPPAASGPRSARPSPWAMSPPPSAAPGTAVALIVRGKPLSARVAPLPFVPHAYYPR